MALVDAIDAEQVREVAQEFFDPARHILVSLGPHAVR
jgi:hypothetical protein